MAGNPLTGLLIRTGCVRLPEVGYLLAGDPDKENEEIQHTISFTWKSGKFSRGGSNFTAHACCIIHSPELGLVISGALGGYSVATGHGVTDGNIFKNSAPSPKKPRYGDIRSIAEIGGIAYAVGLRGMVYRLDELNKWTRIDDGLPSTFNIQALHGFNASALYAVGRRGEVWFFSGRGWIKQEIPTNTLLTSIKCNEDREVYIGGHGGVLLRGRKDTWNTIAQEESADDIWDLEWFDGELYVSTMSGVFRLRNERLEPVDFGPDPPKTTYQLSAAKGVLWSIGRSDVMSFDGNMWTRIV